MMAGQSARGREQWNHSKNAQMLHKMALGLEYLVCSRCHSDVTSSTLISRLQMVFSIGMFKNVVNDMIGSTKKGKLFNDPNIQKVVRRLDEMTNAGVRHPKCDILVELVRHTEDDLGWPLLTRSASQLTTHLSEAQAQSDATGEPVTTKCMVFCQFRDAVTEIVVSY